MSLADGPWQRRWQPLLQQWVVVSASSASRPWSGAMASGTQQRAPEHDDSCYLCPRVTRANGQQNPDYRGAYAFDNDFPSLSMHAPDTDNQDELLQVQPAHGRCRVLCWSERHDMTLAGLDNDGLMQVVHLWRDEYARLAADPDIATVLIFENKGTEIGVSNLHPHGQIYATGFITDTAQRMRAAQAQWAQEHDGQSLLQDLRQHTHTQAHLLVDSDAYFSVVVPFAARFAYETWLIPHRKVASLQDMTDAELESLGRLYQRQVRRYDVLFDRAAPNVTLLHNAPVDDHPDNTEWCFHLAFHPPLRDPEKLKYLAGFESGSNNIVNPMRPEDAAAQLRSVDVSAWSRRFG